ncbi:unnamed protein product [Oppiella nova]|uniref:Uncharacterized protein n=1 Tax=Oppiella nova TaxID=334625 RepID=A0A7R9LRY6_9ACAR|nr:unnamed protein product [Oppiella nova]CAG2166028.1 unnamed protein product [Oppiella nova]
MCPASRTAPNYDVWSTVEPTIDVDVLMPNGTLITVNVMKEITFSEIKELTRITDNIYCCRSGSAADTQAIADIVAYHLNFYEYVLE